MSTFTQPIFRGPPNAPPEAFDPSKASDSELEKYFYPPRPDLAKAPLEYASWEKFSSQKPQFVKADFIERPVGGLDDNRNWAGAVLHASRGNDAPTKDEVFFRAVGTFTVPSVSPKLDEHEKLLDGDYRIANWVGIDGWDNQVALKVGVLSEFTVKRGQYDTPTQVAAIVFRGPDPNRIYNNGFSFFFVKPGDEIIAHVWGSPGARGPSRASVWNTTQGLYSNTELIPGPGLELEGRTALWVFAGHSPEAGFLLPSFQTIIYKDLFAHRNDTGGTEVGIRGAKVFNAQDIPIAAELHSDGLLDGLWFRNRSA